MRLVGVKLVVDIDDGVAKVLVVAGRQVRSWGTVSLDEGAMQGVPGGAAAPANADDLRKLLRALAPFGARTITSLPLYATLFRRFNLPKMSRRYLDAVIASEMVESMPFTADQVDIVWQLRGRQGDAEVLTAAVPKEAMDHRVLLLKGIGSRPSAVYPRAMALAFCAPAANVIIVELGRYTTSLVRVTHGFPQTMHSLDLSSLGADVEAKAQAIGQAIEQIACCSGTESESMGDRSIPVLFVGTLAKNKPLADTLTRMVGRPVLSIRTALSCPEHFPSHEYAANLGLVLADRGKLKPGKRLAIHRRPSVNVLPERHVPRPIPVRPAATFGLLFALTYLAFSMSRVVEMEVGEADALRSEAASVGLEVRSRLVSKGIVEGTSKKIEAAKNVQGTLESHLARLDVEMKAQQRRLELITREVLPVGVRLATVAQQGTTFTLSGSADSADLVIQYAARIRSADAFASVKVVQLDTSVSNAVARPEGSLPVVTFQIKAAQHSATVAAGEPGGSSLSSPPVPATKNDNSR